MHRTRLRLRLRAARARTVKHGTPTLSESASLRIGTAFRILYDARGPCAVARRAGVASSSRFVGVRRIRNEKLGHNYRRTPHTNAHTIHDGNYTHTSGYGSRDDPGEHGHRLGFEIGTLTVLGVEDG